MLSQAPPTLFPGWALKGEGDEEERSSVCGHPVEVRRGRREGGRGRERELPYIGKLSREKTFTFFVVSEPSAKVFSAKNVQPTMRTLHVCGCVAHARGPHLHNNWTGAICESFLCKILVLYRKRESFSL